MTEDDRIDEARILQATTGMNTRGACNDKRISAYKTHPGKPRVAGLFPWKRAPGNAIGSINGETAMGGGSSFQTNLVEGKEVMAIPTTICCTTPISHFRSHDA